MENQDNAKVFHLCPPQPTVREALDYVDEYADNLRSVMIVGITKDGNNFHIATNGMRMIEKYAIAGLIQSWVAECSVAAGFESDAPKDK